MKKTIAVLITAFVLSFSWTALAADADPFDSRSVVINPTSRPTALSPDVREYANLLVSMLINKVDDDAKIQLKLVLKPNSAGIRLIARF